MVGHLDHGRSAAVQVPRRAETAPARPAGQPPLRRKAGGNDGASLARNHDSDALNYFDLLRQFGPIACHELLRTSKTSGLRTQFSQAWHPQSAPYC